MIIVYTNQIVRSCKMVVLFSAEGETFRSFSVTAIFRLKQTIGMKCLTFHLHARFFFNYLFEMQSNRKRARERQKEKNLPSMEEVSAGR